MRGRGKHRELLQERQGDRRQIQGRKEGKRTNEERGAKRGR